MRSTIELVWVDRREVVRLTAATNPLFGNMLRQLGDAHRTGQLISVCGRPTRVLAIGWPLNDPAAPYQVSVEDAETVDDPDRRNAP